ncbi:MAG: divalent-cation tolerance protein CutA [Candidatus Lokiarchaeota archaeon]|nr:divalent-cation tolerance protein CutA [Candidatus Lokiarchaeota archaeon]
MVKKIKYCIFFVTVSNIEEGTDISRILVEEKLAACVSIVPNIISTYWWKNNIEIEKEFLLIIKTVESKSDLIIQKIQETHSYENPECIRIPITKGSEKYLNWIANVVNNSKE